MSEHKTNLSNWTTEQKTLYRDRRNKGLRGQVSAVTVHQPTKDEKGEIQHIPLGMKTGAVLSSNKTSGARAERRREWMAFRRQERKGAIKGS